MKLIGIDYGAKRVGVAVTDDSGLVAFPKAVLPNDRMLVGDLVAMVTREGVKTIVMGESKDARGADNAIMTKARAFASELERAGLTVLWEPEYYTSVEARRLMAESADTAPRGQAPSTALVDAQAAAVILTSYINRIRSHDHH